MAMPTRASRLLTLVLLSGAGLLAIGAASVADALQEADARGVRAGYQAAEATARDLHRALLEPQTLDRPDVSARFGVIDGELAIPADIGLLEAPPERPLDQLPIVLRALVRDATASERRWTDSAELRSAAESLDPRPRNWLRLWLAWRAHRAGAGDLGDAQLAAIDADHEEPMFRSVIVGRLLIDASLQRSPPDWAVRRAITLASDDVSGLIERLRDYNQPQLAEGIEVEHRTIAATRQALRDARAHLAELATTATATLIPVDGQRLLLYQPEARGTGSGAMIAAPAAFVAQLRDDPGGPLVVPWSGQLHVGQPIDPRQPTVVPELLSIEPDATPAERGAVLGFGAMLAACGALFFGGLWATRRALHRESDALKSRTDFLTSVTHELKTPLASIRLLAERLDEGRVTKEDRRREYFGLLAGESARLTVLIDNVLDLGRMERGERGYDKQLHQLDELVAEAVAVCAPLARADGLTLSFEPDGAAAIGEVDRSAIIQLAVNILDNARKYAASGQRITVTTTLDSCWSMHVRDYGPGIPSSEHEQIFDRFARGAEHTDGAISGVGLGLHLAREIAVVHDGQLRCDSPATGPGTIFVLDLPCQPTALRQAQLSEAP